MVASRQYSEDLRRAWQGPPEEFVQRLVIENLYNELQPMTPLFRSQLEYLNALRTYRRVVAIKPRQVGFTTLSTLWFFAKTYRSPHPRQVLQTIHEDDARDRIRRMVDVAYDNLPGVLKFGVKTNTRRTEFQHNKASFRRVVAGKRSQGRSFTFSDYHATEMAFYPEGSSALKEADTAADADLFASIQAAMHDPTGQIVVESTGNGPRGLFYQLVNAAQAGQEGVGYVFLPWTAVEKNRADHVPADFEPTNEEHLLMQAPHNLTPAQVLWRRDKLTIGGYSPVRFRREYPLTFRDPFRLDGSAWFDSAALDVMAALAKLSNLEVDGALTTYLKPEPGRRYYIGGDTSGGVRRDEAVFTVLRDDLEVAALWASNSALPDTQAMVGAELARKYNDALMLCEANKYGELVNRKMEAMGVRLWVNAEGNWWYGTGQNAGDTKREMMVHARRVVLEGMASSRDLKTILQLGNIVEDSRGRIQGRGDEHDDRAISWCLALTCAKRFTVPVPGAVDPVEAKRRLDAEAAEQFMSRYRS